MKNLKISRVLHAGYVFEQGHTQIVFDPIFENPFSQNCYAFPAVNFDQEQIKKIKFDAVFISHFHDDHCSMESLFLLDRRTPIYMFCVYDEMFELIRKLGFQTVVSLQLNTVIQIGSFEIIAWPALDVEVDCIFHIKVAGLNVLNVVDSWIDEGTLESLGQVTSWDMVLWPFQTMREIEVIAPTWAEKASDHLPPEWINQIIRLNPRCIIPSSCQFIQETWSWYRKAYFPMSYAQFQKEINQVLPQALIQRLNPSDSIELNFETIKSSSPLTWVLPVGDQNVDYEFDPDIIPSATSEIAQHFPVLMENEKEFIINFCRRDLICKFESLNLSEEELFKSPVNWKLTLFDHKGEATHFNYILVDHKMKLVEHELETISWVTEIPSFKLFSALQFGEALTSLYMRIWTVKVVDVMEDPLIRCLYTGLFGAYQKNQLKKLNLIEDLNEAKYQPL